jgi:hypothetical protein
MHTRADFLTAAGAAALASSLPLSALANGPVEAAPPLVYSGFATVRYLSLPLPGKAPVFVTVATIDRNHLRAVISVLDMHRMPSLQLSEAMLANRGTLAINGGFFDMNTLLPIGLLSVNGQRFGSLDPTLSGAVVVDPAGILSVVPASQSADASSAIQTGPFLIDPGGTIGVTTATDNLFVHRSFIAQSGDTIVAGVTSNVVLRDLAKALHDNHDAFGAKPFDAAVNLSGANTSGMLTGPTDLSTFQIPPQEWMQVGRLRVSPLTAAARTAKLADAWGKTEHFPTLQNRSAIVFAQRFA